MKICALQKPSSLTGLQGNSNLGRTLHSCPDANFKKPASFSSILDSLIPRARTSDCFSCSSSILSLSFLFGVMTTRRAAQRFALPLPYAVCQSRVVPRESLILALPYLTSPSPFFVLLDDQHQDLELAGRPRQCSSRTRRDRAARVISEESARSGERVRTGFTSLKYRARIYRATWNNPDTRLDERNCRIYENNVRLFIVYRR